MHESTTYTGVIILAAGKGKRMGQTDKLKVMHELKGKPLIEHVLKTVESLNFDIKPVVVVCDDDHSVQNYLGNRAQYAVQRERLGTGHAVKMAESLLSGLIKNVVVLYGDMPFISQESIQKLLIKHETAKNKITLATATVVDFEDWRTGLYDYGRIIRKGDRDYIYKIVEKKDANENDLKIREVNTGFYCFDADWLWSSLQKLKNNNAQGEYYLTDLVAMSQEDGERLSSVTVPAKEAMGINTQEHLKKANLM